MDLSEKNKNYVLPTNLLYSQGNSFRWPGDDLEALDLIELIPYFKDSTALFKLYSFSDFLVFSIANWKIEDLTKSALYFYLETIIEKRKKKQTTILTQYDWQIISGLIINSAISNDILFFIEELNLKKISPENIILFGSRNALDNISDFEKKVSTTNGLKNLLTFLEVDLISIDSLVKDASKQKTVKNIVSFLYIFENGLDKEFLLTEVLRTYRNSKNQKNVNEQIKSILNDLYKSQLYDLETFSVFDLFESSENVKSKTSDILLFSFYQDLLRDVRSDENSTTVELFKLFEEYLRSSKDKTFLFTNNSFNSLKEVAELNERFISAKINQINNILKQNKDFFGYYLRQIRAEELVFFIMIIGLAVVKVLVGSTQKSQTNSYYTPPFAMIGSPTYTMFRGSLDAPQSPSHVNITLQRPDFSGTLKAKAQKVTYSAPKVQPVSITASKAVSPKANILKKLQTAPAQSVSQISPQIQQEIAQPQIRLSQNKIYSKTTNVVVNHLPTDVKGGTQIRTNLLNSYGYYADLNKVKDDFPTVIENTNGVLVAQTVPMDREHTTVTPILNSYTIPRDRGVLSSF